MWYPQLAALALLIGILTPPMAITTVHDLLTNVGFANVSRPLEDAEGDLLIQGIRHSLNATVGQVARDTPLPEELAFSSLAAAIGTATASLRFYTPQLTVQGMRPQRVRFYRELVQLALRRTQLRARYETYLLRADLMEEVEMRVTNALGGEVPPWTGQASPAGVTPAHSP